MSNKDDYNSRDIEDELGMDIPDDSFLDGNPGRHSEPEDHHPDPIEDIPSIDEESLSLLGAEVYPDSAEEEDEDELGHVPDFPDYGGVDDHIDDGPEDQGRDGLDLARISELKADIPEDNNISDDVEAVVSQIAFNRSQKRDSEPPLTALIDEPKSVTKKIRDGAGDMPRWQKILAGCTAFVIASVAAGILASVVFQGDPEKDHTAAPGPQTIEGKIIGNNNNGNSDDSGSDSQPSSEKTQPSETSRVSIPKGGSKVIYSVETEGDVNSASIAWRKGDGSSDSAVDVATPWEKTIGAESFVSPVLKVNTNGTGTVTCKITKNGKVISEETAAGDNQSLECSQ